MSSPVLTPEAVERLAGKRVLVVGDIMLDAYLMGDADRISPEAPVPVVRIESERYLLGGAGNVARNIAALGGVATLAGAVGEDGSASQVRSLVNAEGIRSALIPFSGRPTTVKTRIMARRQDQMIAVCNKGKEQLVANGWSADRIQVIFNAVDLDAWAGDRSQSTLRAELGLDDNRFVMLCASRFAGDKGHKYLIDSVKRLTELCAVPFTLVLAGDGPLLEPTKAQVQELGLEDCVKFIGFRKDIKNLYKGSDLYVNSSQHEALSFLIIEAMAAGLPVIATDMGGNSDIVNDEAGCGMLVEYDNPDSMAVAMKCFLEDPAFAARCRENARRTIEDKFEIHKMARATYGVYEKALHD